LLLYFLAIAREDNDVFKNFQAVEDQEMNIRQLKYDLALGKLYSLDIISTLIGIIKKVLEEFQQPAIHSHVFVSFRGDALLSLLLPLIKVVKKIISRVVQLRKAGKTLSLLRLRLIPYRVIFVFTVAFVFQNFMMLQQFLCL